MGVCNEVLEELAKRLSLDSLGQLARFGFGVMQIQLVVGHNVVPNRQRGHCHKQHGGVRRTGVENQVSRPVSGDAVSSADGVCQFVVNLLVRRRLRWHGPMQSSREPRVHLPASQAHDAIATRRRFILIHRAESRVQVGVLGKRVVAAPKRKRDGLAICRFICNVFFRSVDQSDERSTRCQRRPRRPDDAAFVVHQTHQAFGV